MSFRERFQFILLLNGNLCSQLTITRWNTLSLVFHLSPPIPMRFGVRPVGFSFFFKIFFLTFERSVLFTRLFWYRDIDSIDLSVVCGLISAPPLQPNHVCLNIRVNISVSRCSCCFCSPSSSRLIELSWGFFFFSFYFLSFTATLV